MPQNQPHRLGSSALSRESLKQSVVTSFEKLEQRYPQLLHLIEQHRVTIFSLLEKYSPEQPSSCEAMKKLEHQIDGYFLLLQGNAATESETNLISDEIREYSEILEKVKRILIQPRVVTQKEESERRAKEVIPFEEFHQNLRVFLGDKNGVLWVPNSKKAVTMRKNDYLAPQIMAATDQLVEGLKCLYMDLPQQGFDDWSYIKHFKRVINALLDQMEENLVEKAKSYVDEYRSRFNTGLDYTEKKLRAKYLLSETSAQSVPIIWKSTLNKLINRVNSQYSLDLKTKKRVEEFSRSPAARELDEAKKAFDVSQIAAMTSLPSRIDITSFKHSISGLENSAEEMKAAVISCSTHLGGETVNRINESHSRIILAIKTQASDQFDKSEQDPDGLGILLEEKQEDLRKVKRSGLEVLRGGLPTLGRIELFGIFVRVHQKMLEHKPKFSDQFEKFARENMESFAHPWMRERTKFQAARELLLRRLPEILTTEDLRLFMANLRKIFSPYERIFQMAIDEPGVQEELQYYYDAFDRSEEMIQAALEAQMIDITDVNFLTKTGSIVRDEVLNEIIKANSKADRISDAAFGGQSDSEFETALKKAVTDLVPEKVSSISDLENIIFWLIGRVEAIGAASAKPDFLQKGLNWTREINRAQFEKVLYNVCYRLGSVQRGEEGGCILSSLPKFSSSTEFFIDRDRLLQEILEGLAKAEERVNSLELKVEAKAPLADYAKELAEQQRLAGQYAQTALAGNFRNKNKRLTKEQKLQRKKQKERNRKKDIKRSGELSGYFSQVRVTLKEYMHEYCPAQITSQGPLFGINSFMCEMTYQVQHCLASSGIKSEEAVWKVMNPINEAHVSPLDLALSMVKAKSEEAVQAFKSACQNLPNSKINLEYNDAVGTALASCEWLSQIYFSKTVNSMCKNAEKMLFGELNIKLGSNEAHLILRTIWRFRMLGQSVCEEVCKKGAITTWENYKLLFGNLSVCTDYRMLGAEEKYGTRVCEFLQDQLTQFKQSVEERLLTEREQKQMKAAVEKAGILINEKEVSQLLSNILHDLVTQRCKQFIYACISPLTTSEKVIELSGVIDELLEKLKAEISRLMEERQKTRNGIMILEDLQVCLSSITLNTEGLPASLAHAFETQVIGFLRNELSRMKTPDQLFQNMQTPENEANTVTQEAEAILAIRDKEKLTLLLQQTRIHSRTCYEYLEAIRGASTVLQEGGQQENLALLINALGALRYSLYPAKVRKENAQVNGGALAQCNDHLEDLRSRVEGLLEQAHRSKQASEQIRAISALADFTITLQALSYSLSLLNNEIDRT